MTRHLLVPGIVAATLTVGVIGALSMRNSGVCNGHKPLGNPSFTLPPAEGLSIPTYNDNGERSSLLKVGKCQRQQKRAGLLGLASVTMLDMSNVELDVSSPLNGSISEPDATTGELPKLVDSIKEIPRFLQWNDIQDFEIHRLKVTIHSPAGFVTTIQAARSFPLPKGQLLLDGGVVLTTDATASQLSTDQVVWWPQLGLFAVKGRYAFKNAAGIEKDSHKLFNVRLEPVTSAQEITQYEKRAMLATSLAANH
ncbi:MAG: hypothetical protein ABSA12_03600 [Verrucomicrobiia bacterium]